MHPTEKLTTLVHLCDDVFQKCLGLARGAAKHSEESETLFLKGAFNAMEDRDKAINDLKKVWQEK